MSFGSSQARTTTSSTQTSRNLNIQDVEGVTAGEVGGDFIYAPTLTDMNAFGDASDLAQRALDVGESLQRENLGFLERLFAGAQSAVSETVARSQESLAGTVTALNTIAREESKSGDERIAEITSSAQRQIVVIVALVAATILGYAIFRKA